MELISFCFIDGPRQVVNAHVELVTERWQEAQTLSGGRNYNTDSGSLKTSFDCFFGLPRFLF
jgi:hypothetical protein